MMRTTPVDLEIAQGLPRDGSSLSQAKSYTRRLAGRHYENFTIATYLLPRKLRQHFYNVYAYCRWADDLGDEVGDSARALELLDWWEDELRKCYAGASGHPVFIALHDTVDTFDIPMEPFSNLLIAFRQDQTVSRYPNWDALMGYCRNSANPVGRLVLYLCGCRDAERQALSDFTCTALQLANFWQDVSRDLDKNRVYIPLDALYGHSLSEADLFSRKFDSRYVELMRFLLLRTRTLFDRGLPLVRVVPPEMRVDIELFSRGGLEVLRGIEAAGYNTLQHRPTLTKTAKFRLIASALAALLWRYAGR